MKRRSYVFASIVTSFTAASLWAATGSLEYSDASPTDTQIDAYLSAKKSPMKGIGSGLSSLGRQYNVDPRLVVAIAGAETTFGMHVCAANNAWNWFYRSTCPQSPFDNYEQGLGHVTKYLRLSYLNRGYTSIELIRYKYCAAGCDHWIPLVTTFFREIAVKEPATTVSSTPVSATVASADKPAGDPSNTIMGMPAYFVFFVAAAAVGLWSMRGFRR